MNTYNIQPISYQYTANIVLNEKLETKHHGYTSLGKYEYNKYMSFYTIQVGFKLIGWGLIMPSYSIILYQDWRQSETFYLLNVTKYVFSVVNKLNEKSTSGFQYIIVAYIKTVALHYTHEL